MERRLFAIACAMSAAVTCALLVVGGAGAVIAGAVRHIDR
jgi:hypothetical protein